MRRIASDSRSLLDDAAAAEWLHRVAVWVMSTGSNGGRAQAARQVRGLIRRRLKAGVRPARVAAEVVRLLDELEAAGTLPAVARPTAG